MTLIGLIALYGTNELFLWVQKSENSVKTPPVIFFFCVFLSF